MDLVVIQKIYIFAELFVDMFWILYGRGFDSPRLH